MTRRQVLAAVMTAPVLAAQPTWLKLPSLARMGAPMAYDVARQRVVVFGGEQRDGSNYSLLLDDRWEWDGARWTLRPPVVPRPAARRFHAMAYDAARQTMVLFGGRDQLGVPLDDTWEWDGSLWVQRSTTTRPTGRWGSALAFDSRRQRCVLFGGNDYGLRADTWEWDGSAWLQSVPATAPSPRAAHAMAFDPVRGVTVLFGGANPSQSGMNDLWEWDGSVWSQRFPTTMPSARHGHTLVFDTFRGRTVLAGGSTGRDLWEWDGATWWPQGSSVAASRTQHAMAFDQARGRSVLTGGLGFDVNNPDPLSDTWEWNGSQWTLADASRRPIGRTNHVLAHDDLRGETVLFGGWGGGAFGLDDTWCLDGERWHRRTPANRPPARNSHALAFDTWRQRVILFGGTTGLSSYLQDTWSWDGTDWLRLATAQSPPARIGHALCFDSGRGRVVLFGGPVPVPDAQTWEFDGASWTRAIPATTTPPGRNYTALAYDAARRRTVLFGGSNATRLDDTWEWDGIDWHAMNPLHRPEPREVHALVYDRARGRTVLYGGYQQAAVWEWDGSDWTRRVTGVGPAAGWMALAYDSTRSRTVQFGVGGFPLFPDTWELTSPCDVLGPGHPGGGLPLLCLAPPAIGTSLCLSFTSSQGQGFLALGPAPGFLGGVPFDPPAFCSRALFYVPAWLLLHVPGSPAQPCLPIPRESQLVGLSLTVQGLALQAAGCLRATDALVIRLMP